MAGLTFWLHWLQEQLPGTVLERVPVPGWLIPEVLRLNDAQAGLGDGTRPPGVWSPGTRPSAWKPCALAAARARR
ncbi:MAG: hypothetical protein ABSB59_37285 [Streptosporangiaceae bacterium]